MSHTLSIVHSKVERIALELESERRKRRGQEKGRTGEEVSEGRRGLLDLLWACPF